jgi:hypothetical protein
VPIASLPRDAWLSLVLPLADLAAALFRTAGPGSPSSAPGGGAGGGGAGGAGAYRSLDSLTLSGACRLRRVCTLRGVPPLPPAASGLSGHLDEMVRLWRGAGDASCTVRLAVLRAADVLSKRLVRARM